LNSIKAGEPHFEPNQYLYHSIWLVESFPMRFLCQIKHNSYAKKPVNPFLGSFRRAASQQPNLSIFTVIPNKMPLLD